MNYVAGGFVDEDVADACGIVALVLNEEESEAAVNRGIEAVFENLLAADFGAADVVNRGGALKVEYRADLGAEAAVPAEAGKSLKRAVPGLAVSANLLANRAISFEGDFGFDGVEIAPLWGRCRVAGVALGGFVGDEVGHVGGVVQVDFAGVFQNAVDGSVHGGRR